MHYDTLSIPEATRLQQALREKLVIQPRDFPLQVVGGADISFNRFSTTVYAGIVLLSFPALQPLTYSLVKKEVHFPYVPGYLAFREVPALMEAWEQLPLKPDVLVVDGHGIAHPRRMGIAAHFGALSGQASIGCAKKRLFGTYTEPGPERGAYTPLLHKEEVIGSVLRTKAHVKPVFVSPGHRMDVQDSLSLILQCCGRYRLPEPTRLAHAAVNRFRLGELPEGITQIPADH
ncbi:deoxyribonuclease V [Chitinophaga japonensis]|uniref:Endonuclease V n=1 Tax=Chitinophaga japonensis TaxID=104662 RepID=A0A562T023_CHIJA|nr:deoxyribonuclease V [Chitinophaga japonensis]TWI86436.1 endonuclease V [Chitinophaga japonensis]